MGIGIVSRLCNGIIHRTRKFGRKFGYELKVTQSSHSLHTKMVNPNADEHAWDPDLYKHGNLFLQGHGNPVKMHVDRTHDEGEMSENKVTAKDSHGESVEIIASPFYKELIKADKLGQLLNPEEQWQKMMYALIGILVISSISGVASMSAAGII